MSVGAVIAACIAIQTAARNNRYSEYEENEYRKKHKKEEKPIDLGTYTEYKSANSVEAVLEKNMSIGVDG